MLRDIDAVNHPAYNDAVRNAVDRARRNPGDCFSVYYDGEAVFVRASEAVKPRDAKLICIAQRWDADTVQLRFDGARSEWVR